MSDEYKKQLGNLIESNPYEALFKISQIYRDDLCSMLDMNSVDVVMLLDSCIKNISITDEKVLKELISLEEKMEVVKDPIIHSCHYMYETVNENPSLLDSALDYLKDHRYPSADAQLLRIAIEKPDEKSKIFSFLRDHIFNDAENCTNMVRFAYLSENEEIKSDMLKKLRSFDTEIKGWKNWSQVASLTGDSIDTEKACNALREELQDSDDREGWKNFVFTYDRVGEEIDSVINKDVRKSLSEELLYNAESSILRFPNDGNRYGFFNKIARLAIRNSDDAIPDVMSALKLEVRSIPRNYTHSAVDFHMDTFYAALIDIVKKRPELAKESFSICKGFNKAMLDDERHTYLGECYSYYNLLECLSDTDKSLKPEITSVVRENIRRSKEYIGREGDYGNKISSGIDAGKKLMQKLTTPEKSGSELQRS